MLLLLRWMGSLVELPLISVSPRLTPSSSPRCVCASREEEDPTPIVQKEAKKGGSRKKK